MPKALRSVLRRLSAPRLARRRVNQLSQLDLLETRIFPTAVVTFNGTLLTITGDTDSNEVLVERDGNQLHVAGQNGTLITVQGLDVSEFFFTVNGSFNLNAKFLEGDDVLLLENGLQIRSATVSMGEGENTVGIAETVFSGKLTIKAGGGTDVIDIFQSAVTSNTLIQTGGGDDDISLNESTFVGSTTIKTDLGEDNVEIGNIEAFNRLKCVGKLTIQTGADNDTVSLDFLDTKAYAIDTGDDDDSVSVEDVLTYGLVNIKTGAGEDSLFVSSVFQTGSGTNVFDVGSASDTMSLFNCSFAAAVTINLGSGVGNGLTIDDVTFHGAFTLNSQGTDDEIAVETLAADGQTTFNRAAKFNLGFTSTVTLGFDDPASSTRFLSTATFKAQSASDLFVKIGRVSFAFAPVLTNVTRTNF
jgi:hypothetical protein